MSELNRTDDQVISGDLTDSTRGLPIRRGVKEWMEGDRPNIDDPAQPSDMQNGTADIRDPWAPNAAASFSAAIASAGLGTPTPLLPDSEIGELQTRWNNIQADFVDEPRRSVKEADKLVATTVQRLADGFANERASLEKQWDSGDNVSTEDLRIALQRYRAFFGRLLDAA